MRLNQPVTQQPVDFPASATLMSVTDAHSHITYANEAFVEVSGYTVDELLGQPHNLVRHPDMPPEAFADMWRTLKSGSPWTGLVKNRCKNGDHYWVRANVAPIIQDSSIVGYISVRTKPTADEVRAAEDLYRRFREGRAQGLMLFKGLLVRTGASGVASVFQRMSLRARLRTAMGLGVALITLFSELFVSTPMEMVWLALSGLVVAGVLTWFLEWQVARPLDKILAHAQRIASGQAEAAPAMDRVDEIGMLMRAVNQGGLNLKSLVADVARRAAVVEQQSREIADGNHHLAERTASQSGALEKSATSMLEFKFTVEMNSESAQAGDQQAQAASSVAHQGRQVVHQMIATMDRVSEASTKISEITALIDGIAFQTNILALNAAVEAARAGESGRGFAVVAAEVRSLAGRCAAAAKDIKHVIASNGDHVEQGRDVARQAGAAMNDIAHSIGELADIIKRIAQGSQEQSEGVRNVNDAIHLLEQTTQQNATLVEQGVSATDELKRQANYLVEAINIFGRR
ncbi:methyl-accepting chemotaxis protein [Ideonella paludis]|uniref:PAS domain-containing protein n=2 Tax=Ideonella paludis TaxID=1233411 RepID=A0ABS5DSW7_9BURK|nr:PAS domain-containing protein [Ideonella paludis]